MCSLAIYEALQLVQLLLMRGDRSFVSPFQKLRGGAMRRFLRL
jgi:hypothetical protein